MRPSGSNTAPRTPSVMPRLNRDQARKSPVGNRMIRFATSPSCRDFASLAAGTHIVPDPFPILYP
jgi:hypothetical protein